jgi:tetratricopeptide (TPR) repeat protein
MFPLTGLLASYYHAQERHRAETYFQQGEALVSAGRVEQGVDQYRSALSLAPRNDRYQVALATALFKLGRLDEAEAYLTDLTLEQPNDAVANRMLAQIAERQGRTDEAVTFYHRAIYGYWAQNPRQNRIETRFELVTVLMRAKQKQQASAELMQTVADAPDQPAVEDRVGNLLLDLGYPSNARDVFREVLARSPKDAGAALGAAQASFALGDFRSAGEEYRRAVRLNPENQAARARQAETEKILADDPTVPTLSASERYARSRALAEAALASMEQCLPLDSPEAQTFVAWMNQFPAARPARATSITPAVLQLAQQAWAERLRLCGPPPADQEWIGILMREVGR